MKAADDEGDSLVDRAYARWRGLAADEKSPLGQAGVLRDEIAAITGEPALHFVHVALPHRPWVLSPAGVVTSYSPELITDPDEPGYDFAARQEYQLHSMQVGAADTLVGELVDHLRSMPAWEDTLLVVTSDHGTNLTPPDIGRMKVTDANRRGGLPGAPVHQGAGPDDGEIDDTSVQNLDVLPTIVDLLDAEVDWEFDGHSLVDGSTAHTAPKVSTDVDAVLAIAERRAEEFPAEAATTGPRWPRSATNGDLVGTAVDETALGAPSALDVELAQADEFADLPTDDGEVPFVLAGTITGDVERAARAGRRRERHHRRCRSAATGVTATAGRSPPSSATSTATAPTTWRCTRSPTDGVTLRPLA